MWVVWPSMGPSRMSLIGRGAGEVECDFLCASAAPGEGDGALLAIDGGVVEGLRVVHLLDCGKVEVLENDTAPAGGVGEKRRPLLAVHGELLDIPDAVEGGLRRAGAVLFPALAYSVKVHSNEPQSEDCLDGESDAVGAA